MGSDKPRLLVPLAWQTTTIGNQVTLQRGYDITVAEQRNGNVPVVSSSGITSHHDTAVVKGPGVVLGRKGVVGSVHFLSEDYWPHDTTLWVKDFKSNDPHYVYCFFRAMACQLAAMDVGSANPSLNRNHVHPLRVVWPPYAEQRAISHTLKVIDERIQNLIFANASLESIAQTIFKSWFVDFDPVRAKVEGREPEGMDAATAALFPGEFVESELGLIPTGWNVAAFDKAVRITSGGTPKTTQPDYWGGEIPWFSIVDSPSGSEVFVIATEKSITLRGLESCSASLLPVGATIISARGTVGKLAITGVEMAMNQSCYALLPSALGTYSTFFQTGILVDVLRQRAHGAVFSTITRETLSSVSIVVPPSSIGGSFEKAVAPLMQRILNSRQTAKVLAELRDTLLPRLISGKLRVPEAEKMVEAVL